MATNEVYKDADYLSLPVTADTASGSPVVVGNTLVGVAQTDEGDLVTNEDGYASVALKGAFRLSTTSAVASVGTALYIVPGTYAITATAGTGNRFFGYALSTKSSGAGTVIVKIVQSGPGLTA
jgi:predicted RecA/RadA family phage recombinase